MDYRNQRTFFARQRNRLWVPAWGCAALLVEAARVPAPLWAQTAAGVLSLALLWAAYYLPNYLGLDANPQRRPRWVARARWVVLFLMALAALAAQAKSALILVAAAAVLHLALRRILRQPLSWDLRDADPRRLRLLAAVYAAADFVVLWMARRGGAPELLLVELLLAFAFLAAALVRPSAALAQALFGAIAAGLSYLLAPTAVTTAAVFLWTAGAAHLFGNAVRQNRKNFEDLVESLQAFSHEPRETTVQVLAESTPRLAEDWTRSQPQGQAAVTAWYSRNARLYLYANCQHHLLYRHIVYTLGLLRLARRRVLDFGGGNGDFSRALACAGVETTYLDVPGDAADYLRWRTTREHLPLKIVHELDALEGPYDMVFCLDVIEHLADLKPVFARWKELLRPGGRLVATYYNGPTSTAPMHIDPGYNARDFLLTQGFRDVKPELVGLLSPELMRKKHFMILEKEAT